MIDTNPPLGAIGEFPDGRLDKTDEGEVTLGVAYDPSTKLVRIEFGKPVTWLAMDNDQAIAFAQALLKHAGVKKVELTV